MRKLLLVLTLAGATMIAPGLTPAAHARGFAWLSIGTGFRVGPLSFSFALGNPFPGYAPAYYYRAAQPIAYSGVHCTSRCFVDHGVYYHDRACPVVRRYFTQYRVDPYRAYVTYAPRYAGYYDDGYYERHGGYYNYDGGYDNGYYDNGYYDNGYYDNGYYDNGYYNNGYYYDNGYYPYYGGGVGLSIGIGGRGYYGRGYRGFDRRFDGHRDFDRRDHREFDRHDRHDDHHGFDHGFDRRDNHRDHDRGHDGDHHQQHGGGHHH